jgi:anti-sigma-K factor RskA
VADERTYSPAERERIEELCAAYALGSLHEGDPGWSEFETLLASNDPYFAETLEGMLSSATLLAEVAPQVDAPQKAKKELFERIDAIEQGQLTDFYAARYAGDTAPIPRIADLEKRLKKRTRQTVLFSAILAVLFVTMASLYVSQLWQYDAAVIETRKMAHQRDSLGLMVADLMKSDSASRALIAMFGQEMPKMVMLAKTGAPKPQEQMMLFSPKMKKVFVMRGDLQPLDSTKTYELWQVRGTEAPIPVGIFNPDANSKQMMYSFDLASAETDAFAISIEKAGGSQTPTSDQIIYVGKL